jgi:hypothetical protein
MKPTLEQINAVCLANTYMMHDAHVLRLAQAILNMWPDDAVVEGMSDELSHLRDINQSQAERIKELEGLLKTERDQANGFEKLYNASEATRQPAIDMAVGRAIHRNSIELKETIDTLTAQRVIALQALRDIADMTNDIQETGIISREAIAILEGKE